ncbi:MAG: response regulator, partial [Gammaproteobacteria bacterium]|nr:response regulator [Gammaproteobacteria bacterium]
ATAPETALTTAQTMPLASAEPEPALPGERRAGQRAQYEQVRVRADLVDSLVNLAAEVSISRSRIEQQVGAYKFNLGEMDRTVDRLRDQLRRLEIETEGQIVSRRAEAAARGLEEFDPLEFDRFTHMQQLSRSLMESVNDITNLQVSLQGVTREAETLLLQQARVNTDLQEGLMRTRMVQFSVVLPRIRRLVRQTAQELGKQVELNVAGVEGEMDRTVLDRVVPSLEHMLRNAVDHGIEPVSARRAAGKPEAGAITLEVTREGSEIIITVRDDGAGIDLNAVRRKAVQRGLLQPEASVSDQHLLQFILEAGFSTASEVTQISGRGVGMDVVNSQVKQLGGALQINSISGQGTAFVIRLPFTLSVNRALLVQAGEDIYALPLTSVQRVMRMTHEELETLYANPNPQYALDGQIYQLLYLGATHGSAAAPLPGKGKRAPVLLACSGDYGVAMQVDSLLGSREIVVKSLGPQIDSVKDVAGATIMGDGRVVLILDIPGLIRLRAGLATPALEMEQAAAKLEAPASSLPLVLVVDDSITVRKVTTRLLERHEMRVLTAKDGVDALAVLQQQIPDIMLLDIEMPRMDGYELAAQVRNDARLRHIPMIMITSRSGEKHRERAMQIGVNRYLGKPYKETDLVENIRSLLPQNRTLH